MFSNGNSFGTNSLGISSVSTGQYQEMWIFRLMTGNQDRGSV